MLRLHLAEPSDSPQFTDYGNVHCANRGAIALEPSRSAVITGFIGDIVQISDWARDRGVKIITFRPDDELEYVRTFCG